MKICFIGPANSAHIIKWCAWFSKRGHEVHVISFSYGQIEDVVVHHIETGVDSNGNDFGKIRYLFSGKRINALIKAIKPDIVNVHYATSYGVATAMSGVKGYVLSVWGADIYDFPKKSFLHKALLKYSLRKADFLFSTSLAMAIEAQNYTTKEFKITPFGVDTELFNPNRKIRENDGLFIVGTVKGLSDKYGIKYILEAVATIQRENKIPIRLRIAGKGPQAEEYKNLAKELKIDDITSWLGYISQEEAAKEWANMDVAIIPSTLESESFGVAAVEAQACGTPVIVSDVPGLVEATIPNVSSIVVQKNNTYEIVCAIEELYANKDLRVKLGQNGRKNVMDRFELDKCFSSIESFFYDIQNI